MDIPLAMTLEGMPPFLVLAGIVAAVMLIWDTVEVGRNDAANLVNAVFGARILKRRHAVWFAGLGVVLGAVASSPVIETARKGIFEPQQLAMQEAVSVYVAVYIVDTVLLYGYSAFGMPVSTTACLVFELLGAALAVGGVQVVHWDKAGQVVTAIVCSIFISAVAGFFIQRAIRGAIRHKGDDLQTLQMHGGWVGGGILMSLCYFMVVKGMKNVVLVKQIGVWVHESPMRLGVTVFGAWAFFAILIHIVLAVTREKGARALLPTLAVLGTVCMGFAFGQNDLANCASPGLSALHLIGHWNQPVVVGTGVEIHPLFLLVCGILLLVGMRTENAGRVTRAEVNTGSQGDMVRLWAPRWCVAVARVFLRLRRPTLVLAPEPVRTAKGKVAHYDPLRACTILTVAACVIATASGFGLPVSTTYVAFAAVVATGMADRIMQRGDADLKVARTIWVVFSWFAAALLAAVAAGVVCLLIHRLATVGIVVGITGNLALRFILKRRGDAQEARLKAEARERRLAAQTQDPQATYHGDQPGHDDDDYA